MPNLNNVDIGVCSVSVNGIDLGHTKGGVIFNSEDDITEISVDQYGSSPVDLILTGQSCTVKVTLAETSFTNFDVAFPGTRGQSGTLGNRQPLGANAGGSILRAGGSQVVLHPIKRGATDLSKDIVLYKCGVINVGDINFEVDNQEIMEVTLKAVIDETKSVGNRLGHIGIAAIS